MRVIEQTENQKKNIKVGAIIKSESLDGSVVFYRLIAKAGHQVVAIDLENGLKAYGADDLEDIVRFYDTGGYTITKVFSKITLGE